MNLINYLVNLINFKRALFLVLLYLVFLPLVAAAQEHIGRVVGVSDGDTLTILNDRKQQIKVSLAEIDTPESAQPYGTRANRNYLILSMAKSYWSKFRISTAMGEQLDESMQAISM